MRLDNFAEFFDDRSKRERVLMLICVLALILAPFYFWAEPHLQGAANTRLVNAGIEAKITASDREIKYLRAIPVVDPNTPVLKKIQRLKEMSEERNQAFNQISSQLVPPRQMLQLLHSMLHTNDNVRLVSVQNLPVEIIAVALPEESQKSAKADDTNIKVYKHGFVFVLEGSYQGTDAYLKRVEGLDIGIVWDELAYEVKEYPNALITIKIHTISTSKEWSGV